MTPFFTIPASDARVSLYVAARAALRGYRVYARLRADPVNADSAQFLAGAIHAYEDMILSVHSGLYARTVPIATAIAELEEAVNA